MDQEQEAQEGVVRVKKTKNPNLHLRVLYVSAAGRKVVKVKPEMGAVSIGNESFKVGPEHRFPGKGKFDVVAVQGNSQAMPVWRDSPVGSVEYDAGLNNNALMQLNSISAGGRTSAISWVQVGLSVLLFLAIVGVGIKLNSDFDALKSSIDALAVKVEGQQPNDSTVIQPGQSTHQVGDLGELQRQQQQESGPP